MTGLAVLSAAPMGRQNLTPQLEILDCFSAGNEPLSATDVIQRSGLPRSTVFRALRMLTEDGFLLRDANRKRYILGPRVLRLGMIARTQLSRDDFVAGPLQDLSSRTGETVTFSLLDLPDRICTSVIEGRRDVRYEAHLGERYPIHLGAAGKAMLAFLPEETTADVLKSKGLSKTAIRDMQVALEQVRRDGWVITEGERVAGAVALAAPVFVEDMVLGSVAVVGPSLRGGQTMLEHRTIVLDVARRLTEKFSQSG